MKRSFSIFTRFLIAPILKKFFVEIIKGQENILQSGKFIIASNHESYFDHFFLLIPFKEYFEKIHFIGKMESLFQLIFFGPLYFFSETITVNRRDRNRRKVLNKAIRCLNRNEIIVIYPEGGTNKEKNLREGKTGVAELALKTDTPIIPVGISHEKTSFKKVIKIGEPIYVQNIIKDDALLSGVNKGDGYVLRKVTAKVMEAISRLCGKNYSYHTFK